MAGDPPPCPRAPAPPRPCAPLPRLAAVVELEVARGLGAQGLLRDDAVAARVLWQPSLDVKYHAVHHQPHPARCVVC